MTTTQTPATISAIKLHGYKIELSINTKGKPVARLYKYLTVGKNKDTYKPIEGYFFNDETRREEWIKGQVTRINERANDKASAKSAKQAIRANMEHPFKVGQIYYTSWGYDQTNVDFYEVIKTTEKSVLIQEIGAKMLNTEGYSAMAAMVVPDPSIKEGNPELKPVQFYLNNDKTPQYYIKAGRHSLSLYTKEDKGVYCSWYA